MANSMPGTGRALRADAERTHQLILSTAQRVLSTNPTATMADVAGAAGVSRTTVHRRFATREAMIEAMGEWTARRVCDAVDAEGTDAAPPLVALYQVTARILAVKIDIPEVSRQAAPNAATRECQAKVAFKCRDLLRRAQQTGVIRADVDLDWARRVYYALIHEVIDEDDADPSALATRVVDTLLRGVGSGASLS